MFSYFSMTNMHSQFEIHNQREKLRRMNYFESDRFILYKVSRSKNFSMFYAVEMMIIFQTDLYYYFKLAYLKISH